MGETPRQLESWWSRSVAGGRPNTLGDGDEVAPDISESDCNLEGFLDILNLFGFVLFDF